MLPLVACHGRENSLMPMLPERAISREILGGRETVLLILDRYQYHPGGDPRNPPKDAPSALHSVIVPNVNLPKVRGIILLFRPRKIE